MNTPSSPRSAVALAAAAVAVAATLIVARALADLDVSIGNGDRVAATLDPGSEVESFRFSCPRDARLTVTAKVKKSKGRPAPVVTFRVLDPTDVDVAEGHVIAAGPGAKLTNRTLPASQAYRIEVSGDGSAGDYQLQVKWKSPTTFPAAGDLADLVEDVPFDAEAGSLVSVALTSTAGATAVPTLQEIRTAAGDVVHTFPAGTLRSAKRVKVATGGALVLRVVATGGTGGFTGKITIAPPKPTNRPLRVGGKQIPAIQSPDVFGSFIGAEGGALAAVLVPGASVAFPADAFRDGTLVVTAASDALSPDAEGSAVAGPAVFFGPEGLAFRKGKPATITLPYDPQAFPDGLDELVVFTRDARGRVTAVRDFTIDTDARTVTFPAAHFSAFQAFRVPMPTIRILPRAIDGLAKFGQSIDGDASTVAVGAPYSSDGRGVGSVFVFVRTGNVWTQQARLEPSGASPATAFGYSVALSGDTLAVGALGGAPTPGAAYVFVRNGTKWKQQATLLPDVRSANDDFGRSVSLDGDTLAVGSPRNDEGSNDEGAVYVFTRSGAVWTKQQVVVAADGANGDHFGHAVSLAGDTLVAGSPDRSSDDTGAVYIFERTGTLWTQFRRITASDAAGFARFGSSVCLSRPAALRMVVGAPSAPQPGASGAGEAYVYSRTVSAWVEDASLVLSSPKAGDQVGRSVAIAGDTVVVGAPTRSFAPPTQADTGTVAIFRLVGGVWTFESERVATQSLFNDDFGNAVCLHGSTLFVASPSAQVLGGITDGAAYVLDVTPTE